MAQHLFARLTRPVTLRLSRPAAVGICGRLVPPDATLMRLTNALAAVLATASLTLPESMVTTAVLRLVSFPQRIVPLFLAWAF